MRITICLAFVCILEIQFAQSRERVRYFAMELTLSGRGGHVVAEVQNTYLLDILRLNTLCLTQPDQGDYRVVLREVGHPEKILFTHCFSSLYREWLCSGDTLLVNPKFEHTFHLPLPVTPFECSIEQRTMGKFESIKTIWLNPLSIPESPFVLPEDQACKVIFEGEAPEVAWSIVGEGYAETERDKFFADCERIAHAILHTPPFDAYRRVLKVTGIFVPSAQSGCDIPLQQIERNTLLNASFGIFGADRYLQTFETFRLMRLLQHEPSQLAIVLVNSTKYGGGGVFNHFAIGSADHPQAVDVLLHEIGHTWAGLADEYFYLHDPIDPTYPLDEEPWEPNITTLVNFGIKWKELYELGIVQLHEGGGYRVRGIYRPLNNCKMREINHPFCPVCEMAIRQRFEVETTH